MKVVTQYGNQPAMKEKERKEKEWKKKRKRGNSAGLLAEIIEPVVSSQKNWEKGRELQEEKIYIHI